MTFDVTNKCWQFGVQDLEELSEEKIDQNINAFAS